MRRRWEWPILRRLREVDGEGWLVIWFLWLIGGFAVVLLPAMIVDQNGGDHLYLGTYLLIALIVYVPPLLAGALSALGLFVWFLLDEYGRDLLPRRVREPVTEDLRAASRRDPPGRGD